MIVIYSHCNVGIYLWIHFQIHMVHFLGMPATARRIDETHGMNCEFFMTTTFVAPILSRRRRIPRPLPICLAARHRARCLRHFLFGLFIVPPWICFTFFALFHLNGSYIQNLHTCEKFLSQFFFPFSLLINAKKLFI